MVHQETTQEQTRIPDDAVGLDKVRAQAYEAAALGEAAPGPGVRPWLLAGLKAQEAFLRATVVFFQSTSGQQTLSNAAEWMLDNFYLAQESLRQVRGDMPRSFYRQLPKLVAGSLQGYPRIYDLAQQFVAQSDARLDLEHVQHFILLYQEIQPLTTGELWGLPVMLRWSILAVLSEAAKFRVNAGLKWLVDGTGATYSLRPFASNSYEFGGTANLVRTAYIATSIQGASTKTLTESSATGFVRIAASSNGYTAGYVDYSILANDGTDYQIREGQLHFSIVNKAGTETVSLGTPTETVAVSAGTLTNTFDTDTAPSNAVDIRATAVSSLAQTTLTISYRVVITSGTATVTGL